jgi:hypothetical protein
MALINEIPSVISVISVVPHSSFSVVRYMVGLGDWKQAAKSFDHGWHG